MKLVSMKLSQEEKQEMVAPKAADMPEYGYGTQISLCDDQITSLGLKDLPKVGETMMIHAMVKVTSVSQYEREEQDSERSVTLQITDMAMEQGKDVNKLAKEMYKA